MDLPAPVAPTSATVWPAGTCRLTWSSASALRCPAPLPTEPFDPGPRPAPFEEPEASAALAGGRTPASVGEGDVLEGDLALDPRQLDRVRASSRTGWTSSSSKIFSSAAMPDW